MKTMEHVFDQLLILKCQSGDQKSLSLLVKRWQPKLYGRILKLTKNKDASDDITQDAWSSIVKNLDSLKDPSRFPAWAFTIANRKAYDWIKSVQKDRTVFDSEAEVDDTKVVQEKSDPTVIIKETIKTFNQEDQLILNLYYLENYSIKEIGETTHTPNGTIKSRLFYLREKLKSVIQKGVYHGE